MRLINSVSLILILFLVSCQSKSALEQQATPPLEGSLTTAESGETATPFSVNERESEGCNQIIFSYRIAEGFQTDIVSICPDGTEKHRLTSDEYVDYMPAWSPDGSSIAFLSNRAADPLVYQNGTEQQLFVMDEDGNNVHQITFDLPNISDLMWLPDGGRIALMTDPEPSNSIANWFIVDVATGEIAPIDWLPNDANHVNLSHDGTRIIYNLDSQIRIRNRDGSDDRSLAENARFPAWSPDDTRIAFTSGKVADNQIVIYIVNVDGSNLHRVADLVGQPPGVIDFGYWSLDYNFAWSPDGESLVIFEHPWLYILNLETGETFQLFSVEEPPTLISGLSWQP